MTPEQKAANEQLHEAILNARRANGFTDDFLLTDWMVLTAETRFDADGGQTSAYSRIYRDGVMAEYRSLGLMETHRAGITQTMLDNSR